MDTNQRTGKLPRRGFLLKVLPALGATMAIASLQPVYSRGLSKLFSLPDPNKLQTPKHVRGAWHCEGLVLNTKTKTIHYPTAKLFRYYDRIGEKNLRIVPFDNWKNELNENHFNESKSGHIIEKMALRELSEEISDNTLGEATDVLAMAFTKQYAGSNAHNWRVYDLLILFIALNNSIETQDKWDHFSSITNIFNLPALNISKRNLWLTDKAIFDAKALYLAQNAMFYKEKLKKRILLYTIQDTIPL